LKGQKIRAATKKKNSKTRGSHDKKAIGIRWLSCSIHGIEYDTFKGCPACKSSSSRK
jgi:hypothetical protein